MNKLKRVTAFSLAVIILSVCCVLPSFAVIATEEVTEPSQEAFFDVPQVMAAGETVTLPGGVVVDPQPPDYGVDRYFMPEIPTFIKSVGRTYYFVLYDRDIRQFMLFASKQAAKVSGEGNTYVFWDADDAPLLYTAPVWTGKWTPVDGVSGLVTSFTVPRSSYIYSNYDIISTDIYTTKVFPYKLAPENVPVPYFFKHQPYYILFQGQDDQGHYVWYYACSSSPLTYQTYSAGYVYAPKDVVVSLYSFCSVESSTFTFSANYYGKVNSSGITQVYGTYRKTFKVVYSNYDFYSQYDASEPKVFFKTHPLPYGISIPGGEPGDIDDPDFTYPFDPDNPDYSEDPTDQVTIDPPIDNGGFFDRLWTKIKNFFSGLWTQTKTFFSGLFDKISKPFIDLMDWFVSKWNDFWEGDDPQSEIDLTSKFADIIGNLDEWLLKLNGFSDTLNQYGTEAVSYVGSSTSVLNNLLGAFPAAVLGVLGFSVVFLVVRKLVGR